MKSPLHILHLEDDPNDAELVRETLAGDGIACRLTQVSTGEAFRVVLEHDCVDLILSDYNLPSLNGLDALKLTAKLKPGVPFIFVSGVMGEEFAVLTLQMGATDYVLKHNLVRLPAAVRRAIQEAEAAAERRRMEESLRLHATRMKSILDTSLDAIIVMDDRGVILDWNAQAESMFGWPKADAIGRTVAETIIPPQHREAHVRGLSRFLTTGEGPVLNRRVELTALHRSGWEFPVDLAVTAAKIYGKWQFTAFIVDTTQRKRAERRLAAQYEVTQVLSEAASLEQASSRILQVLCECLGWEVGGLWLVDQQTNLLRCFDFWHVPHFDATAFVAENRHWTFPPEYGMPGRVWSRGEPMWVSDMALEPSLPRAPMVGEAGLHAMIGFPIKVGTQVYGIIEFFSREARAQDVELMQMVGVIGIKIGQFVERTRAEEALRESNERFTQLAESVDEVFYVTDVNISQILYVNPTYEKIWGRTRRSLYENPLSFVDAVHSDDRDRVLAYLERTMRGENAEEVYRVNRPDGSVRWVKDRGYCVRNEQGDLHRLVGTVQDITDRKAAEEALRDSEQRYKLLVDHANDIIYRTDARGYLTYVNPTATRIMQYSEQELLGMRYTDVIRPDQRQAVRRYYTRQLVREGTSTYFEFPAVRKDGTEVWLGQNVQQLFENGQAVGFQAVARDVTERKRAEYERAQLAKRDEALVKALGQIVYEWVPANNECVWSGNFTRVLGYSPQEMGSTTESWTSRIHPEDHDKALAEVDSATREHRTYDAEYRFRHRDGSYRWMHDRGVLFLSPSGELERMRGVMFDVTDRKLAEETTDRLVSIVASSDDAIVSKTLDGIITTWNKGAERIFGYSAEEMVGQSILLLFPSNRQDEEQALIARLNRGERIEHYETIRRRKDGRDIQISLTLSPIRDSNGRIVGASKIARDISARKRAERRLAAQYAVAQVLAQAATLEEAGAKILPVLCDGLGWEVGGLWGVDRQSNLLRCLNLWHAPLFDAAEFAAASRQRTFGPEVGIPGRVWTSGEPAWIPDVLEDPDFPRAQAATKAGLHGAIGFPIKIGKTVYGTIEFFSQEIREPDTDLMQMLGEIGIKIGQFIERKEADEALRRSEERFKTMFDQAPLGIAMIDSLTGQIYAVNTRFAQIAGRTVEEMTRIDWMSITHPDDVQADLDNMAQLNAGTITGFQMEKRYLLPDGDVVWINMTIAPMKVDNLSHPRHLCMIEDITERKRSEDFRLAQLTAERANQAKSEFLSRMSHELRTPLNAVLGFAQLLEMDALTDEHREHVTQILKGGRHLLALVNEVLDIARIEAGRLTITPEPVAVTAILHEAADLVRPLAAARSIQLALGSKTDDPVHVLAEPQRLKQVLLNLLSNGVKYNREGGTLTVSGMTTQDNRYRIKVTDTGDGIPAALMSRLFTPFDRLKADSRAEGTGLGLALSRSLITAMGGTITVDSVEGRGTTFSVELPLAEPSEVVHGETPVQTVAGPVVPPAQEHPVTVLYIEDNQANFRLVERLINRKLGVRLLGAMQGTLGLELAVAQRPDLILLDLNLPDMQGDEVLARLRERPETAGIPVVMLSADAMQKQIDKLLAAGAQRFLTKPVDVEQFYSMLDDFITRKGGK